MQSKSFIHMIRVPVVTGEGGTAGGHGHSNRSARESQNSGGGAFGFLSLADGPSEPRRGLGAGPGEMHPDEHRYGFPFVSTGRGWARTREITWNLSICDFF